MSVLFVVNPASGRGRALRVADLFEATIRDAGYEVRRAELDSSVEASIAKSGADAIVIFGGDGTVHGLAPSAAAAEIPLYHVPLGTENLFAREFDMNRRPERLVAALKERAVVEVDMARCNGLPFLIMCSVGPDASVIHRLAAERKGSISRLSYGPHVVREALSPVIPTLSIDVDGERVVAAQRGIVVVANSRQYALRMDPAKSASMTDGHLDVLFMPCENIAGVLRWGAQAMIRAIGARSGAVHARGAKVRITAAGAPAPAQLDGEAPGVREGGADHPAAWTPLRIDIVPHALPVLVPPV